MSTNMEPNQLLEYMEELKTIASSQQNRLTKEEINQYLSGLGLESNQFEAVYQYLAVNQIAVEGYRLPPQADSAAESSSSGAESAPKQTQSPKTSANLARYRREVDSLTIHTSEQLSGLWAGYLAGDYSCGDELIHEQLPAAIRIAGLYKKKGIPLDELISEGNVGIMTAMQVIRENPSEYLTGTLPNLTKLQSAVEDEIRRSIENMIHESVTAKDQENAILAKTNLLHEAAKFLAEENGRPATEQELAEYTRLSIDEIHDITELSDDTKYIFKN